MSKGIINPWDKSAPVTPVIEADAGKATKLIYNEFDLPSDVPFVSVTFRGQTHAVRIRVLRQREAADTGVLAVVVMGHFIADLWKRAPKTRSIFAAQGLSEQAPAAPKVTFELGDVTLYARAGSLDAKLAHKMAIDRIASAILQSRTSHPVAAQVMREYKVDTVIA